MEIFFTVLTKVSIMVVMMLVGFIITKKKKLGEKGTSDMTWILLNVVTPCVIIDSFMKLESGSLSLENAVLAVFLSFSAIFMGLLISLLFFGKEDDVKKRVLRFCIAFSNCGFMGLPLAQAVVGARGVVYASIFIAVFNFMFWTFGYMLMSGEKRISVKKVLLNPGILGITIGMIIYGFNISIPEVLFSPIESLSYLNTPIAMIILGHFLSKINFKEIIFDKNLYLTAFLKLIIVPAMSLLLVVIFKPEFALFMCIVVQSCTPSATGTVLFASMLKADANLASKSVALSTVFSLITIPLFITISQLLSESIL